MKFPSECNDEPRLANLNQLNDMVHAEYGGSLSIALCIKYITVVLTCLFLLCSSMVYVHVWIYVRLPSFTLCISEIGKHHYNHSTETCYMELDNTKIPKDD
eukprot:274075_1